MKWDGYFFNLVVIKLVQITISGDNNDKLQKYRKLGRPYMLWAGIDGKIKFVFTKLLLSRKVTYYSYILLNVTSNIIITS